MAPPTVHPTPDDVLPPDGAPRSRDLDGRKVVVRFVGVVARVPRYVKLGWSLMNEPTVSARGKAALGGGLAYVISPIDPVPGFIPVLGQLDDLGILVLAVRTALRSAPPDVAAAHLQDAGLSWETTESDLVTIRATAVWVARQGGKLALRAGRAVLTSARRGIAGALSGRGGSRTDGTP